LLANICNLHYLTLNSYKWTSWKPFHFELWRISDSSNEHPQIYLFNISGALSLLLKNTLCKQKQISPTDCELSSHSCGLEEERESEASWPHRQFPQSLLPHSDVYYILHVKWRTILFGVRRNIINHSITECNLLNY